MSAGSILGAVTVAAGLVAGPVAPTAAAAQAAAPCVALQVQHEWPGALSTLVRLDLPSGTVTTLRRLDHQVNAIGYARAQRVAYGIASRDRNGSLHKGHVVRIDAAGGLTDLGPVRGSHAVPLPRGGLGDAVAGAVSGSRLYVRDGGDLYGVDVDPGSPTFLGLVSRARLDSAGHGVDDFDVDPATGALLGVTTALFHGGRVVRINPSTGDVSGVATPRGLPGGPSYASVVLGPDRVLYAVNNRAGLRSRLYRIPLDGRPAEELASGHVFSGSDAAGCLAAAPPPPPPPPPPVPPAPPPPTTPPRPTTTTPAPAPTTTTVPPLPPPATDPPTTTTSPPPVPPTSPARLAVPLMRPPGGGDREPDDITETKRRWGLTVLLLILGAGAVGARASGGGRSR